jgi:hypothetical protein
MIHGIVLLCIIRSSMAFSAHCTTVPLSQYAICPVPHCSILNVPRSNPSCVHCTTFHGPIDHCSTAPLSHCPIVALSTIVPLSVAALSIVPVSQCPIVSLPHCPVLSCPGTRGRSIVPLCLCASVHCHIPPLSTVPLSYCPVVVLLVCPTVHCPSVPLSMGPFSLCPIVRLSYSSNGHLPIAPWSHCLILPPSNCPPHCPIAPLPHPH